MTKIAVVVDGSADLPETLRTQWEIHVVPQVLVVDGERLVEGQDITSQEIYEAVSAGVPVRIGHPPPDDFRVVYKKMRREIEGIVTVTLSTIFNPTLISAQVAGITYPKIPTEVINSQHVSMGLGFVALAAAHAARKGASLEEVAQAAREAIPQIHTYFLAGNIQAPYRAHLIPRRDYLLHRPLHHVPLLRMEQGHLRTTTYVPYGSRGVEQLLREACQQVGEGPLEAAVVHANAPELAQQLRERIRAECPVQEVHMATLTPIVGLRLGPGTVGLALRELPPTGGNG